MYSAPTSTPEALRRVFVGSIPQEVTESEIRAASGSYGTVTSFHYAPSARGWALLTYSTPHEAMAAIAGMNGKMYFSRCQAPIVARIANDKKATIGSTATPTNSSATVSNSGDTTAPSATTAQFPPLASGQQHVQTAPSGGTPSQQQTAAPINPYYPYSTTPTPNATLYAPSAAMPQPASAEYGYGGTPDAYRSDAGERSQSTLQQPTSAPLTGGVLYAPANPATLPPGAIPSTSAPQQWLTYYTADGHPYYFNVITKQTQWERPAELNGPPQPAVVPPPPPSRASADVAAAIQAAAAAAAHQALLAPSTLNARVPVTQTPVTGHPAHLLHPQHVPQHVPQPVNSLVSQPYHHPLLPPHNSYASSLPQILSQHHPSPLSFGVQQQQPQQAAFTNSAPPHPTGATEDATDALGRRRFGPPGANIFVFHIPANWGNEELYDHFKFHGNIISARVKSGDDKAQRNMGFGFVSYDSHESAFAAIKAMHGFHVGGKWLKVTLKKGEEHFLPPHLQSVYHKPRGITGGAPGGTSRRDITSSLQPQLPQTNLSSGMPSSLPTTLSDSTSETPLVNGNTTLTDAGGHPQLACPSTAETAMTVYSADYKTSEEVSAGGDSNTDAGHTTSENVPTVVPESAVNQLLHSPVDLGSTFIPPTPEKQPQTLVLETTPESCNDKTDTPCTSSSSETKQACASHTSDPPVESHAKVTTTLHSSVSMDAKETTTEGFGAHCRNPGQTTASTTSVSDSQLYQSSVPLGMTST